jgi:hypothetical protein
VGQILHAGLDLLAAPLSKFHYLLVLLLPMMAKVFRTRLLPNKWKWLALIAGVVSFGNDD